MDLLRESHAQAEQIRGPLDPPADGQPDGWTRVPCATTLRGPITAAGPTTRGPGTAAPIPDPNNPPTDTSGDEPDRPFSSTTAHRRNQEFTNRATVAKSRTTLEEEAHRRFLHLYFNKARRVHLPVKSSSMPYITVDHVLKSLHAAIRTILTYSGGYDGDNWFRGWKIALQTHIERALDQQKNAPDTHHTFVINLMDPTLKALIVACPVVPEAFNMILPQVLRHYETGDEDQPRRLISDFTVEKGTPFRMYLRDCQSFVESVTAGESKYLPQHIDAISMVMKNVKAHFSQRQGLSFPKAMHALRTCPPGRTCGAFWRGSWMMITSLVSPGTAPPVPPPRRAKAPTFKVASELCLNNPACPPVRTTATSPHGPPPTNIGATFFMSMEPIGKTYLL